MCGWVGVCVWVGGVSLRMALDGNSICVVALKLRSEKSRMNLLQKPETLTRNTLSPACVCLCACACLSVCLCV